MIKILLMIVALQSPPPNLWFGTSEQTWATKEACEVDRAAMVAKAKETLNAAAGYEKFDTQGKCVSPEDLEKLESTPS